MTEYAVKIIFYLPHTQYEAKNQQHWPGNQVSKCLYYPLQTIHMSDLVGCDSPLQIAMAAWHNYFNLQCATQLLLSAVGCHT
jgi:hypothetical protein